MAGIREVRKIGLDPGFGGVKVAEVRMQATEDGFAPAMITNMIPSVCGVGTMDEGGLSLAGVIRSRRGDVPSIVAFDGIEYLVGHNVARYARPIERMDFARFREGPELRALLYAALWQLLDGGEHQVALAVGLPVEVLQDANLARSTERAMARWMEGSHRFVLDGVPADFEVTNIRARIAQPVATWFDWGLDLQGQWCQGRDAAKAPALVIDQGFNTLDLLVVEGGRISTRYTEGETLGMRRAAEMTANNVRRRYGVELSLHEADALVRLEVSGNRKKPRIYVAGELTEVRAQVRQALNALGADVIRFVERNVGAGKKFRILLTGGGALALAERLVGQWPHADVMPEPVLANARGLAKLARRKGFL